jgi:shikimate dehydrogenase
LGFANDLEVKNVILKNKKVFVIGADGAARAVVSALKTGKPQQIYIANRTLGKAIILAKDNKLKVFTGEGMLIWQGAYAFRLWTGKFSDVKIAEKFLKKFLKQGGNV